MPRLVQCPVGPARFYLESTGADFNTGPSMPWGDIWRETSEDPQAQGGYKSGWKRYICGLGVPGRTEVALLFGRDEWPSCGESCGPSDLAGYLSAGPVFSRSSPRHGQPRHPFSLIVDKKPRQFPFVQELCSRPPFHFPGA